MQVGLPYLHLVKVGVIMNRKQRRAEKFNHVSPTREMYQPTQGWFPFIAEDIADAYLEMCEDVRDRRFHFWFEGGMLHTNAELQYRRDSFFLTH